MRREPDPDERRALQVVLTDEGLQALRAMWPVFERGIERHFAPAVGSSAGRVRKMLERMSETARG